MFKGSSIIIYNFAQEQIFTLPDCAVAHTGGGGVSPRAPPLLEMPYSESFYAAAPTPPPPRMEKITDLAPPLWYFLYEPLLSVSVLSPLKN